MGKKQGLTHRQLEAVKNVMRGLSHAQALLKAGYGKSIVTNTHSVFGLPKVKEEMDRRRKRQMAANELTEEWIVKRLMRIADSSIGDLVALDEKGSPYLDWSLLTEDMKKVLNDIDIHTYTEGRGEDSKEVKKIKVRQQDQLRAFEMLMKIAGLDKKQIHISSDEHLIERIYDARRRVRAEEISEGDSITE